MAKDLLAMKCPQCGADIELDKRFESGFCSYCGTKIVMKDAIKKVKIVNQPTAENYLILADREYENKNYKEALKQYDKYIELSPTNPIAIYRRGRCISLLAPPNRFDVLSLVNASQDALELLEKQDDELQIEMAFQIIEFVNVTYNKVMRLSLAKSEKYRVTELSYNSLLYAIELLDKIEDKTKKSESGETVKVLINNGYISIIMICVNIALYGNDQIKNRQYISIYEDCVDRLRVRMPYYKAPAINRKQNGCYIATSVYGSYDAKEVWVLRRYRDYKLDATWHGRLFIKCYYKISPTLVRLFGKQPLFKKVNKYLLDHFVEKLKKNGYPDDPYQDKY